MNESDLDRRLQQQSVRLMGATDWQTLDSRRHIATAECASADQRQQSTTPITDETGVKTIGIFAAPPASEVSARPPGAVPAHDFEQKVIVLDHSLHSIDVTSSRLANGMRCSSMFVSKRSRLTAKLQLNANRQSNNQ